ncbi:alkaline ceramidase 3-like [Saccoglossus kowalevskii]
MAPTSVGFWGVPTSTLDWCEENYVVTSYIAEFWNTVSNLAFIIPPFLGMIQAIQDKLEIRFIIAYFSLLAVGIGSWFFHMTLLYEMQLFDELPMIWGSCIFLYCLIEAYSPPKSHNYKLGSALVLYSMLVTLVYLEVKSPVFFQACYGMLVVLLAGRGLYLLM